MKHLKTAVLYTAMLLVIIFNFTCHVTRVYGQSMSPTLEDGSLHLFIRTQEPEDGDIVIFSSPVEEEYYIKRIFAGPGETVVYNGQQITLGQDEYFVLGDNSGNSRDSRSFGPISRDSLVSVMIL